MVEWYAQNVSRWQQFHVAPSSVTTKQRCKYATWVDTQETRAQNNNNKQLQPLIEN